MIPKLHDLYDKPVSAFTDNVEEIDESLMAAIEFLKGARKKLKEGPPNAAVAKALAKALFARDAIEAAFKAGLREVKHERQ